MLVLVLVLVSGTSPKNIVSPSPSQSLEAISIVRHNYHFGRVFRYIQITGDNTNLKIGSKLKSYFA